MEEKLILVKTSFLDGIANLLSSHAALLKSDMTPDQPPRYQILLDVAKCVNKVIQQATEKAEERKTTAGLLQQAEMTGIDVLQLIRDALEAKAKGA